MTTTKTNRGKRGTIKQILNRDSVYTLNGFALKVSRRVGRNVSPAEIKRSLFHMESEGQLVVRISDTNRVFGKLADWN